MEEIHSEHFCILKFSVCSLPQYLVHGICCPQSQQHPFVPPQQWEQTGLYRCTSSAISYFLSSSCLVTYFFVLMLRKILEPYHHQVVFVFQAKPSSSHRNRSHLVRVLIMIKLAFAPFFRTVSIKSLALSALGLALAASPSASLKTLRCRSSSTSLFRTGSDTRSMKWERELCRIASAGVSLLTHVWFTSREGCDGKSRRII